MEVVNSAESLVKKNIPYWGIPIMVMHSALKSAKKIHEITFHQKKKFYKKCILTSVVLIQEPLKQIFEIALFLDSLEHCNVFE